MGLLVVNSDFERLWNEPYPTISFDNATYSLAGEVGTTLSASFAIFDNYDADVTEQCEITLDNDNVSIEDGMFVCDDLEVGTYQTIATATYSYKSATVTATATINISVQEQQPTSISFNSATYSMSGNEDETLTQAFSVSDDLNNDITSLCSYSFSPNDKGLYVDSGNFKVDSAIAGTYDITVTATYGELTNTATISVSVVDLPNSISFDSNSYTMSGTEGDTITESFTVTDDLNNDITADCQYSLSPNNTGLTASNGTFDASSVTAGTYSVTVTATYSGLTTTATVSMEIQSASFANKYLTTEALESGTFTLTVPAYVNSTFMTSISYSTDNGVNWVTTTINNTAQTITTPTIAQGDKVLWKGIGQKLGWNDSNGRYSYFASSGNFNVSGNIMSLLYGDNFANQTAFPLVDTSPFIQLFKGATKLISAENLALPATTLVWSSNAGCYQGMFYSCTSLTTAPALPATTLANKCYRSMFQSCSSLTTAPVLNATTLADYCYGYMFTGCTSLTTAPTLPATTLADNCYQGMFEGCTSLTTAPALPATTLASTCYKSMFQSCSSLTTAPVLNATTLAQSCYCNMFNGCSSLRTAPTLPATTLAQNCYNGMFSSCSKLTTAPALPATTLAQSCYCNMFQSCTSLTTAPALPATTLAQSCYSNMFNGCSSLRTAPTLPATTLADYCYQSMFQGCSGITSVPSNYLPVTTLADYCYSGMFKNCGNLTTAPELPATTLAQYCYEGMFSSCYRLATAPTLPATTLADYCYQNMFNGCYLSYQYIGLRTTPELPAPVLANGCYSGMFYGCGYVNSITMLATDISAANCLNNWVQNVAATGTFTKDASMTTLPTGASGIPSGWTVVDAS